MKNSPARIRPSAGIPSNWGPGVKPAEGIRRTWASRREFGGRLVARQIGGGYLSGLQRMQQGCNDSWHGNEDGHGVSCTSESIT
jgi:hypothetical protein